MGFGTLPSQGSVPMLARPSGRPMNRLQLVLRDHGPLELLRASLCLGSCMPVISDAVSAASRVTTGAIFPKSQSVTGVPRERGSARDIVDLRTACFTPRP